MQTELQEIRDYWDKKYPYIHVTLWEGQNNPKYFGKITSTQNSTDLKADTIGELISQGEDFLRKLNL